MSQRILRPRGASMQVSKDANRFGPPPPPRGRRRRRRQPQPQPQPLPPPPPPPQHGLGLNGPDYRNQGFINQDLLSQMQIAGLGRSNFEDEGEDTELHVYEVRPDARGERISLRVGTKSEIDLTKDKSHRACLVLFRNYSANRVLDFTELQIRSRHVKRALQEVVGSYPGVNLHTTGRVIMREPPMCLFHYRRELEAYAESSPSLQMKRHLKLCLGYLNKSLEREMVVYDTTMGDGVVNPGLEYQHLWMGYKPGELLYETTGGVDVVSRFVSIQKPAKPPFLPPAYQISDDIWAEAWNLRAERIEYRGGQFTYVTHTIRIPEYDGSRPMKEQPIFPLRFHPHEELIRQHLVARGRRYVELAGVHHRFYDGPGRFYDVDNPGLFKAYFHTNVKHRIIVDSDEFTNNVGPRQGNSTYIPPSRRPVGGKALPLGPHNMNALIAKNVAFSSVELMLCHYEMPGYSLVYKRWGLFRVDHITEVEFNDDAFTNLVYPEEKKQLILSLVEQNNEQESKFDDYIKGKGKGLIFLLHGPPGVGKTFTAESVADYTRRPLLTISSGQIMGPPQVVETRLASLLSLATKWAAIVLIDEADVFMQERTLTQLDRNGLVSTFLRILEYFEGTLFLTTNRAETLDSAFQSRIHLSILYPALSASALAEVWRNAIVRSCGGRKPRWLTKTFLAGLAKSQANGREVKNIVSLAHALARKMKRDMCPADILQGVEALKSFAADFGGTKAGRGLVQPESGSGPTY